MSQEKREKNSSVQTKNHQIQENGEVEVMGTSIFDVPMTVEDDDDAPVVLKIAREAPVIVFPGKKKNKRPVHRVIIPPLQQPVVDSTTNTTRSMQVFTKGNFNEQVDRTDLQKPVAVNQVKTVHNKNNVHFENEAGISKSRQGANFVRASNNHKKKKTGNRRKDDFKISDIKDELVHFKGYALTKYDAKRLFDLRKQLLKCGIPHSEVEQRLNVARQRAVKAVRKLQKTFHANPRKNDSNENRKTKDRK